MARRPYSSNPSSQFRGPLSGARTSGPVAGAPAELLSQWYGQTKVAHNPFMRLADVVTGAGGRLTSLNVGAGTGAAVSVDTLTARFAGLPAAVFTFTTTVNEGSQWFEGAVGDGIMVDISAIAARNYNPPIVASFVTQVGLTAANVNSAHFAIGLVGGAAPVLTTTGTVATGGAQNGHFIRQPAGSGGVSGAMECVSVAAGVVQATTTTALTYVSTATVQPRRFGIRLVMDQLSAAANPVMSGESKVEFWVDDTLAATHSGIAMGVDLHGGICAVRTGTGTITATVPYWTISLGPVQ